MFKKIALLVIISAFLCGSLFAMCGSCEIGDAVVVKKGKEASVNVNNTICPVTGDKVDMKDPVTVEYKGKIYNLCCPACIKDFNAEPEKYSAKVK
ncbi:MAG: YHS domain-containing protein [Candidatus Omnitrophica bacterium]|nr:YHS domain-containing protein [Candidatus Omnitrophota bacterium]